MAKPMTGNVTTFVSAAARPRMRSSLGEKPRPIPNSKKITPMEARFEMVCVSAL